MKTLPAFSMAAVMLLASSTAPAEDARTKNRKDAVPPSGSASYRPQGKPSKDKSGARPDRNPGRPDWQPERPQIRPSPLPETPRPETRPGGGSGAGLPSQGGNGSRPYPGRPGTRPTYPDNPSTRPVPDRPSTRPSLPQPERPTPRPVPRPDDDNDFIGMRPGTKPAPWNPGRPQRPDWPDRPVARPKPILPGIDLPRPTYPINRPPRPQRPTTVNNVWVNHTHVWNQWTVQNNITINNFVINRPNQWGTVNHYWNSGDSWRHWQRDDWWKWRRDLWDYRRNRCYELWNSGYWMADQLFDIHWWSYCPWARGYGRLDQVPAWWWWTPVTWDQLTAHVKKLPREQEPLAYDPGVSVVFYDDRVYIEGREQGPAWKFVKDAREQANPDFRWEPPFPGGRHDWLPLGVWALTPQEQGEASMFLQLAISRDGLISGGFTNVASGEDLPVKGGTDRKNQRVAWHMGDRTDTVIETGLAHLTQDVAGAFIHFANGTTQTWLLVRLPAPGLPPGPVRIPYLERR